MRRGTDHRMWWIYATAQAGQLALVVATTDTQIRRGGLVFLAFTLIGLWRRWRGVWTLLVIVNTIPLVGALGIALSSSSTNGHPAIFGQGVEWGHLITFLTTGLVIEAILLSRQMRTYVRGPAPELAPS